MKQAAILIALLSAVCRAGDDMGSHEVRKPMERRFSGTISRIHFGVPYDGNNFVVVDGMKVVFASGGRQESPAKAVWGKMIGFSFPRSACDDFKGYHGRKAEVFAGEDFATGPAGERLPFYSLHGNGTYYVKLLK